MKSTQELTRSRWFAAGGSEILPAQAAVEAEVQLSVNGEAWLGFHCTPDDLEALAIGFLYNQEIIQSAAEVETLQICESRDHIDVWLDHSVEKPADWSRTSGCLGGVMRSKPGGERTASPTAPVIAEELFARVDAFLVALAEQDHLRQGLHTSMLLDRQEVSILSNDIGRHNTLDKIAGTRLMTAIQLGDPALITTGRISADMVDKAARMGVPLVMSLHSASDMAIAAAEQLRITLVGHARRSQVDIYTHPVQISFGEKPKNY